MRTLNAAELRQALQYDPETGVFAWAPGQHRAGAQAGYLCEGYRVIKILGRPQKAHRLAWLYVYGDWPAGQIDHVNGERDDNRIANLRDCSQAQNRQNLRRSYRNNSAGLLGTSFDKKTGKWRSQIQVGMRKEHIGLFASAQAAHEAYVERKRKIHTHCSL